MSGEPQAPADPAGHIADNVAFFARALRGAGLKVGPGAVLDAAAALADGGLGGREDVYWTLHAVFVKKREDSAVFDQAFKLFWRRRALVEKMMAMLSPEALAPPKPETKPEAGALRVHEAFNPPREKEDEALRELSEFSARLTISEAETLKARDFAQMSAEEATAARRLIARIRLPDDKVPTRRFRPSLHGPAIDLRRTLRRSMRAGGATIDLAFRKRVEKHPPVVALVDISGSMAEYSRVLLHFLHALTDERRKVHSFVFGTRLTNVSRMLRAKDPDEALALCGKAAPDWEGGTRIGQALGPSTGNGRGGCSRAGRSCCSSPTGWSGRRSTNWPSRPTGCTGPAASWSGSIRCCASTGSRRAPEGSAPCSSMWTPSGRSTIWRAWRLWSGRSPMPGAPSRNAG